MLASIYLSLLTIILLWTIPKPLPLTPPSQSIYVRSRQTLDHPVNVDRKRLLSFYHFESLPPIYWVGLNLTHCDSNSRLTRLLSRFLLPLSVKGQTFSVSGGGRMSSVQSW